jgi:succinate-semialdehyde dehydrogenase/glutarate-semialdehyde dehydrogenase
VLAEVQPGSPAYAEELFGPVAVIIPAADEAEAIARANDTPYGLGAGVFTRDRRRGAEIARHELDAGMACVNDFVRSSPQLPFGGTKQSGYGRELGGDGLRALANIKTVSVR